MMHTLIIGAGPAGLATAAQLVQRKLPFTVLESGQQVGISWRNHYDRLHLHTVKQHSALPHLPYPEHYPLYPSRLQMVDYLDQYARHFGIEPKFGQTVRAIARNGDGSWCVHTQTDTFQAGQVVVATGYNRVPNQPELPGQHLFAGTWLHSYQYRSGAHFAGQRVLVVGMGNTGAEIALDLLEQGATPFISVRGEVSVVKREVFGRPAQPTAILLGKLPNWLYDFMAGFSQRLSVGNLSAYGLHTPPHPPSRLIREFGKIPVIDIGTLDRIKAGEIMVVPGIRQINLQTVTFTNNTELPFEAIIQATGYRPGLISILGEAVAGAVLDERGYPKHLWFNDDKLAGLYFLGFATPLSGILRGIRLDSEQIIEHMAQTIARLSR